MSGDYAAAWWALEAAAAHVAGDLGPTAKALADAADAYAKARWARNSGPAGTKASTGKGALSGVVVPFAQSIDNPEKSKWRDENQCALDAIQRELGTR